MENAKNTKRANKLNIKYSLAQEDPIDIERRVRRAFEILFDEMEKTGRLNSKAPTKEQKISNKIIKQKHEINRE
ncbi:MAG: hypothetical protein UX49_C0016G0027 [Candidatus Wolfebacteria bacterium GW2011_GWC2_46_275]|uniref:Uncharacterized protein n=1 Tax=Candidatus Wolfebacteria bacterium GW2011_GWB1_47_1 TaxID=1619007 RepID=A0A0G4AR71_9BACT|nr:MAG: hypothetical protein UX70_C0001G0017 [Candidatus Wolfebacteria bacterium GW2011_GWB1_47_1]KKU36434.1 MAG: hypothetical protein UX49_C0016G0027 [Candidatus Wolfebacteria bacterium GW2011_GWC2_46_275]KKU41747.1 MAG: hypothetical protein UX58_C0006G0056 [Candidatus Wolfebacteria bacterium GW2011_GWB2_46_69]KKU53959.1 MAG: hypothetical protein UX76_C0007G0018 [Candidatus Wolfebacteria bacterium GW2011_GWC1_47_103]KKU72099.1 MAG: hypothetical protein UX96_C0017G0027 [Candidatus Wolfebacteria